LSTFGIAYLLGFGFIAALIYLVRRQLHTPAGQLLALRFGPPAADEDPSPKARFQYAAFLGLLSILCLWSSYAAFLVAERFVRVDTLFTAFFFLGLLLGLVFAAGALLGTVQGFVALFRTRDSGQQP
jgi:hypothetical protein